MRRPRPRRDDRDAMIPAGFSELAEKVKAGGQHPGGEAGRRAQFGQGNPFEGTPFGDFFGPFGPFGRNQPERRQQGVGSGFIMNSDGYILTNNHVVEGADQIKVKLSDGKDREGKVVGRDPKTDLAVVKIDGSADLRPLALGDSEGPGDRLRSL
jgi:serine protease Do